MKIQTITLCLLLSLIRSQEFNDLACSGFVEFPNDPNLEITDFSSLEVHLYTMDGILNKNNINFRLVG